MKNKGYFSYVLCIDSSRCDHLFAVIRVGLLFLGTFLKGKLMA